MGRTGNTSRHLGKRPSTSRELISDRGECKEATVWFGEAPTSEAACEAAEELSPGHCDTFHATDEEYFDRVHYWATPQEDCADDDDATTCVTQEDWVDAWTTLRGG